jgi:hypothetical protein
MTHLRACVYLKNTQVNEVAVSTPYMRVIRPYIKRHERCSAAIVFAMAALFDQLTYALILRSLLH